jgi:lipoprotein-releasing system permease protein
MSFELRIALRYLFRSQQSRRSLVGAGISLLVMGLGVYLVVTSSGSSAVGVITLVVGMLATTLFSLLSFFSVFTTVSVLGVVLGVAALPVVLALTTGFQKQFREKVLGVNAHVIVQSTSLLSKNYRETNRNFKRGFHQGRKVSKNWSVIRVRPRCILTCVHRGRYLLQAVPLSH